MRTVQSVPPSVAGSLPSTIGARCDQFGLHPEGRTIFCPDGTARVIVFCEDTWWFLQDASGHSIDWRDPIRFADSAVVSGPFETLEGAMVAWRLHTP